MSTVVFVISRLSGSGLIPAFSNSRDRNRDPEFSEVRDKNFKKIGIRHSLFSNFGIGIPFPDPEIGIPDEH